MNLQGAIQGTISSLPPGYRLAKVLGSERGEVVVLRDGRGGIDTGGFHTAVGGSYIEVELFGGEKVTLRPDAIAYSYTVVSPADEVNPPGWEGWIRRAGEGRALYVRLIEFVENA